MKSLRLQVHRRVGFAVLLLTLAAGGCGSADAPGIATREGPDGENGAVPELSSALAAETALYELFVRDFSPSGDLAGVLAGLDRIEATGAQVVWLMPIHPVGELNRKGTLGSPYSARDYTAINPAFGDEDDFRALVNALHARGMKLILDWVPNHTAWDHVWVAAHPDYYIRGEDGGLTVPRDLEGNLTDWTDVAALDYENPELRRAMTDAMRYWIDEFDIDGFRVDVAGFVPRDFFAEAIPELRAAKDGVLLMLAEWGDLAMHEVGFDLTYPWDSYARLKEVWEGEPAQVFVEEEIRELGRMPEGGYRMRMTTNHDETAWDAPPVEIFGGVDGARAAFVAMSLLPGPPLLYNGQEIESPQELPLFEREAIDWDRPGAEDARAFYRSVIELARTHPDLVGGTVQPVSTDVPTDVIAYQRGSVVVVVNARPAPVEVTFSGVELEGAEILLRRGADAGASLDLDGYAFAVLDIDG